MTVMQALRTILPLGFTAGINLYLTLLVVGLSIRLGWVSSYPPGLETLASTPVMIVAGVLYVVEFIIDKIPFLDSLWDLLHTFIRPVGAVLIATSSLSLIDSEIVETTAAFVGVNPRVQLAWAIVMCVIALITHSGKAGTRAALNASGTNITCLGVVLSLAEDIFVALLAFAALRFPVAANIIAWSLLVVLIMLVPQLMRWAWFTFKAMLARFKAFVSTTGSSESLPSRYAAMVAGVKPQLIIHCQAQGTRPLKGRYGYLILSAEQVSFVYRRWWRVQQWTIDRRAVSDVNLRRGLLMMILELTYSTAAAPQKIHFACTYDRRPLAEQALHLLGGTIRGPVLPQHA